MNAEDEAEKQRCTRNTSLCCDFFLFIRENLQTKARSKGMSSRRIKMNELWKKWISCNWKQIAIVSHTFQNILIWRFANEWTIKDLRAEAEDKETAKYITWKDELKQLKSFIKFAFLFQFIQWVGRFFVFFSFRNAINTFSKSLIARHRSKRKREYFHPI